MKWIDEHFDEHSAKEAIKKMWYRDDEGKEQRAPYFTEDEVRKAFDVHMDDVSDYTIHDFAVTMNLLRSDYNRTLERYTADEDELRKMVVNMAVEYLQDDDADYPSSKIWHNING